MSREIVFSARKKDFRVDTFAAGGPGGQHQNKTQTGVRITHIESGISAECRETRSQETNKRRAFQKLAKLLIERYVTGKKEAPAISTETIRTYHEPDNRVKDHASGFQQTYDEVVDAGDLTKMVDARKEALHDRDTEIQ